MSGKKRKTMQELVEDAFENASRDRALTITNILDLTRELKTRTNSSDDFDRVPYHQAAGAMAKYIEVLQRSNEQVVKLAGIVQRYEKDMEEEVVDGDWILDTLQDESNKDTEETVDGEALEKGKL